jgi:hypothetical protein
MREIRTSGSVGRGLRPPYPIFSLREMLLGINDVRLPAKAPIGIISFRGRCSFASTIIGRRRGVESYDHFVQPTQPPARCTQVAKAKSTASPICTRITSVSRSFRATHGASGKSANTKRSTELKGA